MKILFRGNLEGLSQQSFKQSDLAVKEGDDSIFKKMAEIGYEM